MVHGILVYVSKQRWLRAERLAKEAADQRDRMARVRASDEVWAAFRAGLGTTPVNVALGELVRREVGRRQRRTAGDEQGVRLAVEDARAVADELQEMIARLDQVAFSTRSSSA
jgi:flagellar biosynthesis/type III secretory pathway protein FliH